MRYGNPAGPIECAATRRSASGAHLTHRQYHMLGNSQNLGARLNCQALSIYQTPLGFGAAEEGPIFQPERNAQPVYSLSPLAPQDGFSGTRC